MMQVNIEVDSSTRLPVFSRVFAVMPRKGEFVRDKNGMLWEVYRVVHPYIPQDLPTVYVGEIKTR